MNKYIMSFFSLSLCVTLYNTSFTREIVFHNNGSEERYYNICCNKGFEKKSKAICIAPGSSKTYNCKCPRKTKSFYASWTQGPNMIAWYGPFKLPSETTEINVRDLDYDYCIKKCLRIKKWVKNCNLKNKRN